MLDTPSRLIFFGAFARPALRLHSADFAKFSQTVVDDPLNPFSWKALVLLSTTELDVEVERDLPQWS